MDIYGWLQIVLFLLLVLGVTKPLGTYLHKVFEEPVPPLYRVFGPLERALYRVSGVDPRKEQNWKAYAVSLLLFSLVSILASFLIFLAQGLFPLNDRGLGPLRPDLALNTAVSFATNTNWQSYAGESTMSPLAQMLALTWQNFVSAAVGIGVALALCRGLTRQPRSEGAGTLGNFWVDLVRATVYVFLPLSLVYALILASQGVVQTLSPILTVTTVEGGTQSLSPWDRSRPRRRSRCSG